jgi:hypothetical protein
VFVDARPGDCSPVPEEIPSLIVVNALSTLLLEALERPGSDHVASEQLKADLRALVACVEGELERSANKNRLRAADPPTDPRL